MAASTAPEAPSAWPYRPFVPETAIAVGMVAERRADGARLGRLVERRARSVGVDIADALRFEAGVGKRLANRARRVAAVGPRSGHVIRVVAGAEAEDLGDRRRPAAAGGLELLEHEDRRRLAHDEPVAVAVEGPGGGLGVVVAGGEDADEGERPERQRRERRLGPARQRQVDGAVADGVEGLADGHRPGRAGVRVADGWPGQAEIEGHVARAGAAEHRERQGRRDAARPARHVSGVLLLAVRDAAERGADPDAGPRPGPVRRAAGAACSTARRAAVTLRALNRSSRRARRASRWLAGSKSSICAAILDGKDDASKRSITRTADRFARTPLQRPSTPVPIGVTAPMPVMTTRRPLIGRRPPPAP